MAGTAAQCTILPQGRHDMETLLVLVFWMWLVTLALAVWEGRR